METIEKARKRYLPTTVDKDIPLEFDLGNLTAYDYQTIETSSISKEFLKNITRDNTQLLINEVFSLPTRQVEFAVVADLPNPTTLLPREKPLPKQKPMTRWEKFAKEKGIKPKEKRSRMLFDEQTNEWKPRWGYNRANDDTKDWLIEVPSSADPMEDQYEKRIDEKKKRIEKNKKNQQQNLEKLGHLEKKFVVGGSILPAERDLKKLKLSASLKATKASTASLGKFDRPIRDDPIKKNPLEKPKRAPATGNTTLERKSNLNVLEKILKKSTEPLVNTRKAIRQVDPTGSINATNKSSSNAGKKGKSKSAGTKGKKGKK